MKRYIFALIIFFGTNVVCIIDGPLVTHKDRKEWRQQQVTRPKPSSEIPVAYAITHPTEEQLSRATNMLSSRLKGFNEHVNTACAAIKEAFWQLSGCSKGTATQQDKVKIEATYQRLCSILQATHQLKQLVPTSTFDSRVDGEQQNENERVLHNLLQALSNINETNIHAAIQLIHDHLDLEMSRFSLQYDTHQASISNLAWLKLKVATLLS